ncbi:DUF6772 family protein [Candidatus Poribacteria bacterium]
MQDHQPTLSKFDPLPRTIVYDDFDRGLQGWTQLIGNYEDTLDSMLPEYWDLRPPMLSSGTMWDTGTAGSMEGTYSLKLATRPQAGSISVGLKRLTWRQPGPVRLEAYFTFKPEAAELRLSEQDVRTAGLLFDIQDEEYRWMPHLRYLNAMDGVAMRKWQFKRKREPLLEIGGTGKTKSHFHLAHSGWEDIPGGKQELCYNEVPTKYNWYYLCVDLDLEARQITRLQCNSRVLDVTNVAPMMIPAMPNLMCMLNILFWVETDVDKRAFLYIDSVLLSGDWK